MSRPRLMPLLAIAALLALASAGLLLVAGLASPPTAAHLAFALGVLPLILAAMAYFVPVLTRTGDAGWAAWWPPLLAWGAGMLAVVSFALDHSPARLALAAALGTAAALSLGGWTLGRARHMLGTRHRGLDWYLAALLFLLAALAAVALMPAFPGQRKALRLFHLHANLLGFVGLTALGTLQVLLPTCLGKADPDAAKRLHRDLKCAAGGALMVAAGGASMSSAVMFSAASAVALLGAALYAWVIVRMLLNWQRRFGAANIGRHGAAASLAAAALSLLGLTMLGTAHGLGGLPARSALAGFVIAFLLPLVSGAVAQLLPVWLRPGPQGPWHVELRTKLCRWGGVRGGFLLLLGLALVVAT